MKQTQVITSTDRLDFEKRVNALTKDGWHIVPESMRAAVSSTYHPSCFGKEWGGRTVTEHLLVACLEKESST